MTNSLREYAASACAHTTPPPCVESGNARERSGIFFGVLDSDDGIADRQVGYLLCMQPVVRTFADQSGKMDHGIQFTDCAGTRAAALRSPRLRNRSARQIPSAIMAATTVQSITRSVRIQP